MDLVVSIGYRARACTHFGPQQCFVIERIARHDKRIFSIKNDLVGMAVLGKTLDRLQIKEKELAGQQ